MFIAVKNDPTVNDLITNKFLNFHWNFYNNLNLYIGCKNYTLINNNNNFIYNCKNKVDTNNAPNYCVSSKYRRKRFYSQIKIDNI